MALRQFASKCSKSFRLYVPAMKPKAVVPCFKNTSSLTNTSTDGALFHPIHLSFVTTGTYIASPVQNNTIIDLFTPNLHKKLYMPTNAINKLKVYQDINISPILIDENKNKIKIIDPPVSEGIVKKEAHRMLIIRRKKMKKHKLIKLRKRMKFVFQKIKLRRELRKEQAFRTQLLTQVEAADKFDPKAYVENILHTIRYQPVPETPQEKLDKYRQLKKKNRYQTSFVRPQFED